MTDETKRDETEAEQPGTEESAPGASASAGEPILIPNPLAAEGAEGVADWPPPVGDYPEETQRAVRSDLAGDGDAPEDDDRDAIDLTALIASAHAADEDDDDPDVEAADLLDPAAFGLAAYDPDRRRGERVDAEPVEEPDIPEPAPVNPLETFRRMTPASARRAAEQRERGFIFVCYHTPDDDGNPQQMHVRRVSFSDRTLIGSLPGKLQSHIFAMLAKLGDERSTHRKTERAIQRMMRNLGRGEEIADAYLCAGAIDPPVFLTLEEAEERGGVYVKDIDLNDRQRFMQACDRSTTEAAKALIPFPAGSPVVVEAGVDDPGLAGAGLA